MTSNQGVEAGVPGIFAGVPASVLATYAGKGQDRKRGREMVAEEKAAELELRLEKAEARLKKTEEELVTLKKKLCGVWEHVKRVDGHVGEVDGRHTKLKDQLAACFGQD